jgi:hypothetical protein
MNRGTLAAEFRPGGSEQSLWGAPIASAPCSAGNCFERPAPLWSEAEPGSVM